MDIQFNHLESLHWLWGFAPLAGVVIWAFQRQRRRLLQFASEVVLARLIPTVSYGRRHVRAILVLVAMFMLVAGLLDPRWGVTFEEVEQQGIDLIVAVDASRSMLAEDTRPDRLTRAKQYILDLVDELGGDRIGLVTVAGESTLSCPLTVDYGAFRLSLADVDPKLTPRGGSKLGDGLRLAARSFTDDVKDYKAIILFTDGEDHGSFPVEAATAIYEDQGIRVYTVGIGDAGDGARIPVEVDGRRVYLTHEGREVWSKMDSALLSRIARAAGGAFLPVGTGTVDMKQVYEEQIAPVTRRDLGTSQVRRYHVQYQWFAAAALFLLFVESFLTDRKPTPDVAPA